MMYAMTETKHVFVDADGNVQSIHPTRLGSEFEVVTTTVRREFDAVVFTHTVATPRGDE